VTRKHIWIPFVVDKCKGSRSTAEKELKGTQEIINYRIPKCE
jgi:hypothetical protein